MAHGGKTRIMALYKDLYPELYKRYKTAFPTMSDIEKMIEICVNVCHYCYAADVGCQCWNDE